MVAHGVNHWRSIEGTASWFEKVGFKAPRLNAWLSAGNEVAIGTALVLGLLTSVAAAALAATMFVAFWSIHRFVFHRPNEGYEYVFTLAALALALAVAGPGSVSLDAAFGIDENLDGWVGGFIYAGGLLLGGAQLAFLWRKPD
jgi:putative oxidoreductase